FAIDTANNIYTVGAFVNTVNFDPGPGIYILTSNGGVNTFVSKLDSAGNFIWAKQLDGSNNIGFSITLDVKESIYVAGEFGGLCDFDPSGNSYTLTSSGLDDAYLFKWSQVLTGLQHMNNLSGLNVFPNPFVNNVQISLPEKAIITVSNIAGQVILKTILPAGANAVSLANQPGGAYLLNVQTGKSSSNAVLIKSY
ncbi:MAG: T9SS type A sorting domain-containing protein, partial [Bacteroidia bacterium]